jgi:hypothetical protein
MNFLTLREKHRFRAFENRLFRTISGPKRDEVVAGMRRLIISRRTRWASHIHI